MTDGGLTGSEIWLKEYKEKEQKERSYIYILRTAILYTFAYCHYINARSREKKQSMLKVAVHL